MRTQILLVAVGLSLVAACAENETTDGALTSVPATGAVPATASGGTVVPTGGMVETSGGMVVQTGGMMEASGGTVAMTGGMTETSGGAGAMTGGMTDASGGVATATGGMMDSSGGVTGATGGMNDASGGTMQATGGVAPTPDTPCPGSPEPHGCYTPKSTNHMNCPAKIFEQSGFYPPLEEWSACSSPAYEPCIYLRPDGTEANCACDLGLHWLCVY